MRITWKELMVHADSDALLSDWRWMVGEEVRVLAVNSLGDLFVKDAEGEILWLQTGVGRLSPIANSVDDFNILVRQPDQANEWFEPQLVEDLIASGKRLKLGQCYSYRQPPMLGGEMAVGNFEPMDLFVHCGIFGQLARQIRYFPDGTKIEGVQISRES